MTESINNFVEPEIYLRNVFENTIEEYVGEKERYDLLIKFIDNSQGSILDAGCGCKEPFIIANKENSVALDFTQSVFKTLKVYGFKGHRVLGSVVYLPFKDKCFEKTVCSEVVPHLPTFAYAETCIRELERVSKAFLVTTPNKYTFTVVFRMGHKLKRTHPNLLDIKSFRNLFAHLPVNIFMMHIAYPHIDSNQIPFFSRFRYIRKLITQNTRISKTIRQVKITIFRMFFPRGTSFVAIHNNSARARESFKYET
ncbi:MAG: methyltransferase domain-containing protein [Candidatus Bathyarchaeota archaeon]|nr:methyltransferase domain-containing protein [Candidatus Bathyarchaeota archaeon]